MTAQQEIAPAATKAFHSCPLMGLNTESEQDPQKSSNIHAIYQDLFKPGVTLKSGLMAHKGAALPNGPAPLHLSSHNAVAQCDVYEINQR